MSLATQIEQSPVAFSFLCQNSRDRDNHENQDPDRSTFPTFLIGQVPGRSTFRWKVDLSAFFCVFAKQHCAWWHAGTSSAHTRGATSRDTFPVRARRGLPPRAADAGAPAVRGRHPPALRVRGSGSGLGSAGGQHPRSGGACPRPRLGFPLLAKSMYSGNC